MKELRNNAVRCSAVDVKFMKDEREYCDKRHLRLQQKRYSTSDRRQVTGVARLRDRQSVVTRTAGAGKGHYHPFINTSLLAQTTDIVCMNYRLRRHQINRE